MTYTDDRVVTAWTGWAVFAAAMMIMAGVFQAIAGLVAIFNDDYYVVLTEQLAVDLDYSAWGWTHLIVGVLLALAGGAVLAGRVWGRTIGVILAGLSALAHLLFISAQPFWSIVVIAINVLVIYALCVHGGELAE